MEGRRDVGFLFEGHLDHYILSIYIYIRRKLLSVTGL
jgi:hypothetical protein